MLPFSIARLALAPFLNDLDDLGVKKAAHSFSLVNTTTQPWPSGKTVDHCLTNPPQVD